MKFFADTASMEDLRYSFSRGVDDGITTNPKILETTGDLSQGVDAAFRILLNSYPKVPVSLETDLGGLDASRLSDLKISDVKEVLLRQAYDLANLAPNVVVKIPICEGGLAAVDDLSIGGIKTNVTCCMTPYQALTAAERGATYVSLFANRMLDSKILTLSGSKLEVITDGKTDWKKIVKENAPQYTEQAWDQVLAEISYVAHKLEGTGSELIVGSIRSPKDIERIVKARPQIITIPTGIVRQLTDIPVLKQTARSVGPTFSSPNEFLGHPMTLYSIQEFEAAAATYRK